MELENRIRTILQMDKFNNLSSQDKEMVFQSILANCLILSKEIQDRYLNIISNRLVEIVNLKDSNYYKNGNCYGGIVESVASGPALDLEQTIFPFKFYLKYREYSTPLGQMTKSILHEFGHLVIKKDSFKLTDDAYLIDMGGLVISKLLKNDYGHMLTEIINEFTTFLSFRAFITYNTPNEDSKVKMREYAAKMGFSIDEVDEWLKILPNDLFTCYAEESLSSVELEDGTNRMFNQLYDKYTPLVRLMMFTFQNPLYSYADLKQEFEKGNGLAAKINGIPVNDLFFSYYESSFHIQNLFDSIVRERVTWENFCLDFDSKMMDSKLDEGFITRSVELFENFYNERLKSMVASGSLTNDQATNRTEEFQRVSSICISYYESIKDRSFN